MAREHLCTPNEFFRMLVSQGFRIHGVVVEREIHGTNLAECGVQWIATPPDEQQRILKILGRDVVEKGRNTIDLPVQELKTPTAQDDHDN